MIKRIFLALALLGVLAAGVVVYLFLKPTDTASQPLSAIPLTAGTATLAPSAVPTATVADLATATEAVVTQEAPVTTETAPSQSGNQAPAGLTIFEIDPARSEARFIIDEVLEGAPKTVIGTTDQVSGQIGIDAAMPGNSQVGVIQVNARTLTTDNEFRNRAIKNRILNTNEYEFVTFTPTALSGLPDTVTVGQAFTFQVSGDLTVRDQTRPVTFDVEVTPVSENEIQGVGSTVIPYADFGIVIPKVPAVASVSDEVRLEIDFVAAAVQ